ncbi:hypothetical protein [Limnohabitans sp.]|jgi:hypothetical protein|uniref:hypothetical protein n=1 Tax=Limnohabitans sp. TaxID=1907725 RepID=UPI002FDE4926
MWAQRMMWVVWPGFLVASVLEILVFAFVDPQDLQWMGQSIELSRQGVYTLSFFVFWALTCASSALTVLLSKSAVDINS